MGQNNDTTIPKPRRRPEGAASGALVVLHSPDRAAIGRVERLDRRRRLSLGRSPGSEGLVLDDSQASRVHAAVEWEPDFERYRLSDARSTNGTRVNGAELASVALEVGDIIRVGESVLWFTNFDPHSVGWCAPPDSSLRGRSAAMRQVLEGIASVATTALTVLIQGETGTGKELVAREVHRLSVRSERPFEVVNCAAMPVGLVESEFFGHVKGGFTGAQTTKAGLLRLANGGTLFLDEVGELPLEAQAKLLRVLEDGQVRPVGAERTVDVDVRFVAATNRSLDAAVEAGRFRADLLARLNQWRIDVPPLRQRPMDLEPIVEHVIDSQGPGHRYRMSGDFFEALALYDWPHNVRELVAVIRRGLVLLPNGGLFEEKHLPQELLRPGEVEPRRQTSSPPPKGTPPSREELIELMRRFAGNVSAAARYAGRSRQHVYRWLQMHDVDPAEFR